MASAARIPAPARLRADRAVTRSGLATPFQVVHLGQSALVFGALCESAPVDSQLIISHASAGLMPGGFCVDDEDFSRVRAQCVRTIAEGGLADFSDWTTASAEIEPVDLHLSEAIVFRRSVTALRHKLAHRDTPGSTFGGSFALVSAEAIRSLAPTLAEEATGGVVSEATLLRLIGAGPGTTPSGDDLIVGTLAALNTLGMDDAAARLGAQVLPVLDRTTAASRHYLSAAADNRFGEHVHELVLGLIDDDPAELILNRASSWGASSGIDLLSGLVATLSSAQRKHTIERAA